MQAALDAILRRFITRGRLRVRWPDGRFTSYAGPPDSGPAAGLAFNDRRTVRRLILNPEMALGEAYMDGGLIPVDCGIHDVLSLILANFAVNDGRHPVPLLRRIVAVARRLDQLNSYGRARRNVAHHYDLNGRLYSLFLDRDRQYSCAYFRHGDESLEEAQIAKKRHIAAKLCLDRPDLAVLDIGCGWGGLALTLARDYGARVTGITLSAEQLQEARARAAAEGLEDRASFELLDYRAMHRPFDRIVSVGMFEHVGVGYYPAFFETVARCPEAGRHRLAAHDRAVAGAREDQSLDWQVHLPGRLLPGTERDHAQDRVFGVPLITDLEVLPFRITRRRCDTGGGDLPPIATPSPPCTTSASAACGNSPPGSSRQTGLWDRHVQQFPDPARSSAYSPAVDLPATTSRKRMTSLEAQGTEARIGQPGRRTGRVVRPGLGPAGNEKPSVPSMGPRDSPSSHKSVRGRQLRPGASRKWGDQAAMASCGPCVEAGSKRLPNAKLSAPL